LDLLEPLTCLQESEVSVWLQGRTEHLEMFVKVSGQSAQLEAQIGKLLSRLAPGSTPEVLGFNSDLGVVVTRKLEATNLSLEMDTDIWLETVRRLAKLQRSSLGFLTELQVPRLDLPPLLESCQTLISNTAQLELLGLQPQQIKQIQSLAPKIAPALEIFEAAGLPQTLVHGDFHVNNVMVEHGSPKIIDWSEAAIASPLLDLGRFLEFLNRKHLNSHPAQENNKSFEASLEVFNFIPDLHPQTNPPAQQQTDGTLLHLDSERNSQSSSRSHASQHSPQNTRSTTTSHRAIPSSNLSLVPKSTSP
jgi:thiamine kinase-like enzyme